MNEISKIHYKLCEIAKKLDIVPCFIFDKETKEIIYVHTAKCETCKYFDQIDICSKQSYFPIEFETRVLPQSLSVTYIEHNKDKLRIILEEMVLQQK